MAAFPFLQTVKGVWLVYIKNTHCCIEIQPLTEMRGRFFSERILICLAGAENECFRLRLKEAE